MQPLRASALTASEWQKTAEINQLEKPKTPTLEKKKDNELSKVSPRREFT
jgi:hypothetical protein